MREPRGWKLTRLPSACKERGVEQDPERAERLAAPLGSESDQHDVDVAQRYVERGRFAMQHILADQVPGEERRSRVLVAREDRPLESLLRLEHRAAVDENGRF